MAGLAAVVCALLKIGLVFLTIGLGVCVLLFVTVILNPLAFKPLLLLLVLLGC